MQTWISETTEALGFLFVKANTREEAKRLFLEFLERELEVKEPPPGIMKEAPLGWEKEREGVVRIG